METINAKIRSTHLGGYDGGFEMLTTWLHLEFDTAGQGFGGYCLDGKPIKGDSRSRRTPSAALGLFISRILEVVGVDKWEDIPGNYIRIKHDHSKVHAIGNIVKDIWFDPSKELKELFPDL